MLWKSEASVTDALTALKYEDSEGAVDPLPGEHLRIRCR